MKHFLVILGITALVWLGVSMSEKDEYPMRVRVEMSGYDTVRYAILQADTSLDLQVTLSGFHAFLHSLRQDVPTVQIPLHDGQNAVAVSSVTELLRQSIVGAKQVRCNSDSLRIVLSERGRRSYKPKIDEVEFTFTEQYGLYGEPVITPDEVTLFGPDEVLATIPEVKVAPTGLYNISSSGTYRLSLEPVWERYADVHPSCREVTLWLPVEAYVEKDYVTPIQMVGADTTVTYKLYPEQVTVRAWVAQRDLQREPEFAVTVAYADVLASDGRLTPELVRFPDYVRPRSIEPAEVQCVVIK